MSAPVGKHPPKSSGKSEKNDHIDDDSDDELLAAAAAWAQRDESNNSTGSSADIAGPLQTRDLSLHITQLPYDTNELDLRRLFAEQGCKLSSIRLVYDKDEKGRKTVFRGVAFVDLFDQESYDKALSLNRKSNIRGRKLNVRPTRSKEELASIVRKTRELVWEKIQKQREEDEKGGDDGTMDKKAKNKAKKKEKKEKAKSKGVTKANKTQSKTKLSGKKDGISSSDKAETKEPHKLTKKERNRRAAIIMGMKRRGR